MLSERVKRVAIIGGGVSGVLLAYHLLQRHGSSLAVTLIEKDADVGRGLAFRAPHPENLLNVRASNMSALEDRPDHFWHWARAEHPGSGSVEPGQYLPRHVFGRYVAALLDEMIRPQRGPSRLTLISGEAISMMETSSGARVDLADGQRIFCDAAVLASGHQVRACKTQSCFVDPWAFDESAETCGSGPVFIVGTGLTMVDHVIALLAHGYQGKIYALSRRGLLPRAHHRVAPAHVSATDIPVGASIATLTRWLRRFARDIESRGGEWRSAIDALRPHTHAIWKHMPLESRRRFLVHARTWWDVHRHRMAPEIAARIEHAVASGQLSVIAGRLESITPQGDGATVRFRRRRETSIEHLEVGRIIECTGVMGDPAASPVLSRLIASGQARLDPLKIGIDVSEDCSIIDRRGQASERLYAVGPVTTAAFWEIIAVPDIRKQCQKLAATLTRQLADELEPL